VGCKYERREKSYKIGMLGDLFPAHGGSGKSKKRKPPDHDGGTDMGCKIKDVIAKDIRSAKMIIDRQ
jgi:hypothetical protein